MCRDLEQEDAAVILACDRGLRKSRTFITLFGIQDPPVSPFVVCSGEESFCPEDILTASPGLNHFIQQLFRLFIRNIGHGNHAGARGFSKVDKLSSMLIDLSRLDDIRVVADIPAVRAHISHVGKIFRFACINSLSGLGILSKIFKEIHCRYAHVVRRPVDGASCLSEAHHSNTIVI